MSAKVTRTYGATFKSTPTLDQLQRELAFAERIFHKSHDVAIDTDDDGWVYLSVTEDA
ncbi:hypothetical protein KIV63_gp24 [Mycobacterium phage SWU2]|uniref:Uncharacterized protein n=1 Tax=Mycobacterium phage SWU2 TaxID=2077150 RepID=A0A2K9VI60_9CAUD|nr:hypothetical protein KIV63_gp24 [Mycobacterium phage SWU2]AUV62020.1 hypothetical protein JX_gp61 [Mycobacterium phage SWU2]